MSTSTLKRFRWARSVATSRPPSPAADPLFDLGVLNVTELRFEPASLATSPASATHSTVSVVDTDNLPGDGFTWAGTTGNHTLVVTAYSGPEWHRHCGTGLYRTVWRPRRHNQTSSTGRCGQQLADAPLCADSRDKAKRSTGKSISSVDSLTGR